MKNFRSSLFIGVVIFFSFVFSLLTLVYLKSGPHKVMETQTKLTSSENKPAVIGVTDFSCEGVTAAVGISVDRSDSMRSIEPDGRERLTWAKDAAHAFVDKVASGGTSTLGISINSFGGQGNDGSGTRTPDFNATLDIALGTNYPSIKTAIDNIQFIKPTTCTQCGLRIANQEVLKSPDKKAVIIFSDGEAYRNWEGIQTNGKQAAIDEADSGRTKGIEYWVIGYGEGNNFDEQALLGIAGDPDHYFYRPDTREWNDAMLNILYRICHSPRIILPDETLNGVGDTKDILPEVDPPGSINSTMSFSASSPIVSFNPDSDDPAYQTQVRAENSGTTDYFAKAKDIFGSSITGRAKITVIMPKAWCQAQGGDVIALNNVRCLIPSSCTLPDCTPAISKAGDGSTPGIVVAGKTIDDGPGGQTAPPQAPYTSVQGITLTNKGFDYDYFMSKVKTTPVTISQINTPNLMNVTSFGGYRYVQSTCPATIPSSGLSLVNKKIVLFVPCDLDIEGTVSLQKGKGFFMTIVKGNINISPNVHDSGPLGSLPDTDPELEGVYFSDGNFNTGTKGPAKDQQLHVRGSAVAANFVLSRDLPDNSTVPGELFEFGPDQNMLIPSDLSSQLVSWQEIAP